MNEPNNKDQPQNSSREEVGCCDLLAKDNMKTIKVKLSHLVKSKTARDALNIKKWCTIEGTRSGDEWIEVSVKLVRKCKLI